MINSTPFHHQFSALILLMLTVLVMNGCTVRGPGDAFIPAPFDAAADENRERIDAVLADDTLKLRSDREYYIGPGDEIALSLVGRPDILGEDQNGSEKFRLTITDSPMITLPLIGGIKVHGKTAAQLENELKLAYESYIQNPVPIVSIERRQYDVVTVLGAVKEPGRYSLEPGDTLLDAIFRAGGLTLGGKTNGPPPDRYLKVYREKTTRQERVELSLEELLELLREEDRIIPRDEILVPLEEFIFAGDLDYNIPIVPNDIVYIPPAGTVMVQGYVNQPGIVFLGPSARTLSQVIVERRGMRFGGASRAEVVRTYADGSQESFFLNIRRIMNRKDRDFFLRDNDQVFVFRHPFRAPLEAFFNIFRATVNTGASATYNPVN